MKIYRQKTYSASIPGQLKKIQKLEGIYAMNINQGKNPLSKEMSDLAYKIARENDVYRQKFRKKVGSDRDTENYIINQYNQHKENWLDHPLIKKTSDLIKQSEQKLSKKGFVVSQNLLTKEDKKHLSSSLNANSFRNDSNFMSKAGEFDHFYKKDAKKMSAEGKKQMSENSFYFKGTPNELSNPQYYENLGFNNKVSELYSAVVPNHYSDSLYTINVNNAPIVFHNKLHKFDQAILDTHEIGHFLSPNGHHYKHLVKENAANIKALSIAKKAKVSKEAQKKVKELHKLQLDTNDVTKNQENYAYFNLKDHLNNCNYVPKYK